MIRRSLGAFFWKLTTPLRFSAISASKCPIVNMSGIEKTLESMVRKL